MKNQTIIDQMTLEEKASLLSGENFWNTKPVERLGIPSIMMTDGPHGLRKQGGKDDNLGLNKSIPATCFPTAATLANSWDVEMLEDVGRSLGREGRHEQVSVILGPGLNIKRNPLCGRNFEYFSEDPYLSGKLAAAMIRGIEEMETSACPKHFAVNSQEHMRMSINEIVDQRAFRELYLEGFRIAVMEGKPGTIMSSYNQVNGVFANENQQLLKEILVEEWGFDGVVITDWGGNNDRVAGLIAGNHLEMPSSGGVTDQEVIEAVRAGIISEELLNERVDTLLSLIFQAAEIRKHPLEVDYEQQHRLAVEYAQQSMVLLKNEAQTLPLKPGQTVAVIGDFAKKPRYQGAGSSLVEPAFMENAYDALSRRDIPIVGYSRGFKRFGGESSALTDKAVALAGKAELVLLFLGLDEGREAEGIDRDNMGLRVEQLDLLEAIRQVNENIVVVLSGGSPVELPFDSQVKAILHGYLGGQGGGEAIASLLTGEAVPSGKLAETYPLVYQDVPSHSYYPGKEQTAEHRESIYIGYRYFDTVKKEVRYPFGHGLSYTSFEYSNLRMHGTTLSFDVKNSGPVAGAEIAQLYIHKKGGLVFRAEQELKGFQKKFIKPGETVTFQFELDKHTFAFYHIGTQKWVTEPGEYQLRLGASSRDIRLAGEIQIQGDNFENPYDDQSIRPYLSGEVGQVSSDDFAALYGQPMPEPLWDRNADLGMNDTIIQGTYKQGLGRLLNKLLGAVSKYYWLRNKPIEANNVIFVHSLRFSQLSRFSQGRVSKRAMENILVFINRGFIRGIISLIKGR